MQHFSTLILILLLNIGCTPEKEPTRFSVMAWNILHGANDIENGPDHAIAIIKAIDPDIILMIETYGSGKKIADALGYHFHLVAPEGTALDDKRVNLAIFSKFPFGERIDTEYPFYLGGRDILINDQKVRFFVNWFHYLPWNDAPENMGKSGEELLVWERTETRVAMIQKVLPYLKEYTAQTDSVPLIFGGDMNSPSHLDWGTATKEIHGGLVVPWYATTVLEGLGFVDSFRSLHPDPLAKPGITWNTKGKNDAHRIDYIFSKGPQLKAIHSESYKTYFNTPFDIKGTTATYPSDHGIVMTTFELYEPPKK